MQPWKLSLAMLLLEVRFPSSFPSSPISSSISYPASCFIFPINYLFHISISTSPNFHFYALLCWYFNISGLLSFGLLPFGLPSRFYSLHIRCCFTTLGLEGKFGNERKLIYFFLPFFFKIKRQDPRTLRINVSHGKITV